jgi:hypothetical protein
MDAFDGWKSVAERREIVTQKREKGRARVMYEGD